MNVLFMSLTKNVGGGELSLLSILKKCKFTFLVLPTCKGQFTDLLDRNDIKYEIIKNAHLISRLKKDTNFIVKVISLILYVLYTIRFVKLKKFDLIYMNNYKSFFIGYLISYFFKCKYILHIRDSFSGKFFEQLVLKRFDHLKSTFIVNSKHTLDTVKSTYNVNDIKLIYNGVDIIEHVEENLIKDILEIGVFSRISKVKGQKELLKSFENINNKNIRINFYGDVVHGESDYFKEIKKIAYNLDVDVVFHGYIDDPVNSMKEMNVVILPTINPEPFGRVIIEAQMLGKIIISNNLGGPKEIIVNNVNGFLVDGTDIYSYANKVDFIMDNWIDMNRIMESAKKSVRSLFTTEIMADKVICEIKNENTTF